MYHQKPLYPKLVWTAWRTEDRENHVTIAPLGFLFLSFGAKDDILDQMFSKLLDPPQLNAIMVVHMVINQDNNPFP